MYKIKITGDSTMDLSKELLQQYDMDVIPLYINMEEQSYRDGIDIVPDDIYSYVNQTGKLSKTSAPTIEDYTELFRAYKKDYDAILHFNISSAIFQRAPEPGKAAARDGGLPIDSKPILRREYSPLRRRRWRSRGWILQSIVDEIQI
ncbi:MAG: DegV family protein [Clostridia bacterium]